MANGIRLADGTTSVALRRGLLKRALREEAERRGVRFEFGKRLDTYQVGGDHKVIAHFTNGTQAEGDLLIGADGIHSATRPTMDPAAPKPSYTGLLSIGGYNHSTTIAPTPTPSTSSSAGGRSSATWSATAARSGGSSTSHAPTSRPRRSLPPPPPQEWKRRLLELFADDLPRISEILQATHSEIGAYPCTTFRPSRPGTTAPSGWSATVPGRRSAA